MGPNDHTYSMLYVRDLLWEEYLKFKSTYFPGLTFPLLESRFLSRSVRGYYAHVISLYISENTKKNISSKTDLFSCVIPFVVEVVITIQYYHNQVLDAKSGRAYLSEAQQNTEAANLLKTALYQYIQDRSGLNPNERLAIASYVSRMLYYVDIGQFIEKTGNTYIQYQKNVYYNCKKIYKKLIKLKGRFAWPERDESIRSSAFQMSLVADNVHAQSILGSLPLTKIIVSDALMLTSAMTVSEVINKTKLSLSGKAAFVDLYFKRISLTCGALYVLTTQLIMELMALPQKSEKGKQLLRFARRFGVMRQIVNDCCDWSPASWGFSTKAKTADDAMSDLKNRNITLPLLFHLNANMPNSRIERFLKGELTDFDDEVMLHEIIASKGLRKAINTGRKLAKEAVSFLIHPNRVETAAWYLMELAKIADYNKFYRRFYCAMKNGP